MKRFSFLYIIAVFLSISDLCSGFVGRGIFIDVGAFVGCFKGKEKEDCPDVGFIGDPQNVLFKGSASHGTNHKCCSDCIVTAKTKTKMSIGGTVGLYVPIDENYSIGIEGFSEWHDVQYKDGNAGFRCEDENCRKQVIQNKYKYNDDGSLRIENASDTQIGICSDFAPSLRVYDCVPIVKTLRHHQYGAMLGMKFYTAGGESYIKLAGGMGQLSMKNPVAVGHGECNCVCDSCNKNPCECSTVKTINHNCIGEDDQERKPHKYTMKKVKCRKGLAWEAAIGTRITRNLYMGLVYMGQRNLTKNKIVTYTNHRIGVSLSVDFGR